MTEWEPSDNIRRRYLLFWILFRFWYFSSNTTEVLRFFKIYSITIHHFLQPRDIKTHHLRSSQDCDTRTWGDTNTNVRRRLCHWYKSNTLYCLYMVTRYWYQAHHRSAKYTKEWCEGSTILQSIQNWSLYHIFIQSDKI